MALVSQPIAVAAERCKSKLVADPSITVGNLYQILDRFLTKRGTNDLVALLKCVQGKSENDYATKFGPVFLELKDLLLDLIQLAPNCVLPKLRLNFALEKLNGDRDRRWHPRRRSLGAAATRVRIKLRCALFKLRELSTTTEVFVRFVKQVSVPNEFVAQPHRMRINSDQW